MKIISILDHGLLIAESSFIACAHILRSAQRGLHTVNWYVVQLSGPTFYQSTTFTLSAFSSVKQIWLLFTIGLNAKRAVKLNGISICCTPINGMLPVGPTSWTAFEQHAINPVQTWEQLVIGRSAGNASPWSWLYKPWFCRPSKIKSKSHSVPLLSDTTKIRQFKKKERFWEEELYSFICIVPLYIVFVLPQLQFDCN